MPPEDKNKIEELKKTLYSRQNFKPDSPMHDIPKKTYEVKNTWTPPVADPTKKPKKHWPLAKILIWFSVVFFFVAAGIAGFIYYYGYNTISADNVDINITGPTVVDAGQNMTFSVGIDNKNQLDLQDAYLDIEYPDGARRDASQTEPLVQDRISLGTIASGAHIDRTASAVFFGLQGTQETIKITLEYHVLGSTNLFAKNKDYLFTLGAGPISVVVTHVAQVNAGQDVSFKIAVTSNSTQTLSNLALNATYPFGFTFKNALPAATLSNSIWRIGDLAPGDSRIITITGTLDGQENDQRAFKFNVGIINPTNNQQIATVFYADTETVGIQKPFIGLGFTFNKTATNTYPVSAGSTNSVDLSYSNNMPTTLTDGVVTINLTGAILDRNSVIVAQGFYQSANNTITWDKRTIPGLGTLNPGDTGDLQFSFGTLPFTSGAAYTKSSQKVTFAVNVTGTQVTPGGSTPVSSSMTATAPVNSNITLAANATYNSGPFKNTGAIPPKAEKATTYNINWAISNTFNNTSNVVVTGVLPSYVKFLNNVSPQNEAVTYDPLSGQVTWAVGNIKTNTGYISASRKVTFQVSLSPSLSQVGTTPTLIGDSTLTAMDTFTNVSLTAVANSLTTDIVTDPKYKNGQGMVVAK